MADNAQNMIVLAIVAAAAAYLGWNLLRWWIGKSSGSCGSCHGCAKSGMPTNTLVSLETKPADDGRKLL